MGPERATLHCHRPEHLLRAAGRRHLRRARLQNGDYELLDWCPSYVCLSEYQLCPLVHQFSQSTTATGRVVQQIRGHADRFAHRHRHTGLRLPDHAEGWRADRCREAYVGWASAFNGNPYVWFATQNEPNNTNQQNAMISGIYKAIRGTGNNTIVPIDPATYSTSGMDASMFREFNNVVWDVHFYGWIPAACIYSCEPAASLAGNINAMGAITSANGVIPTIVVSSAVQPTAAPRTRTQRR